ncbi:MAG: hypothetical protein IPK17_35120 [Chloroflexi bacterium]|uniref:hypothetical protein n=1 Tax=Candidatus Flexifilum breve TaxID=3140694 RepID=UPI0031368609|nr:hypothetical protein [Chloroflexota bacterium]
MTALTPVENTTPPAAREVSDRTALTLGIWFTVFISLAIVALGVWLTRFELATPDLSDGFFYEWQLATPNFWNAATAWIGFALHNLLIWGTTWWAQERYSKYTGTLRPANYWALAINAVFIVLHYVQTAVFYDGIAQDLPSWTAQFTVIMMLFVILAMENRRRGMVFGKKINFRKEFYGWLRRYHGYAFSFAVIFTFWFHPMVPTFGHVFGFVHVILVMLQGSLMFTRTHLDRKWNFLLEIIVLPHAAMVALGQGTGIVYMFLFGFLTIFIVTQMHGLGLKAWVNYLFGAGYLLSILFTYLVLRAPYQANEIIRIPAIEYLMVFLMYGFWWLGARLLGQFGGKALLQKAWQEGEPQAT